MIVDGRGHTGRMKSKSFDAPWEMEDEALEIIVRRHPELKGKTFEEIREIMKAKYPTRRPKTKKPANTDSPSLASKSRPPP